MIRNVVFDIGRVLIQFDWDAYMQRLFTDAETRAAVTAAMWGNPDWDELDRGVLPLEKVTELFISKEPEYAAEIRLAVQRLGEAPAKQPYAIPWIEELKAAGLHVWFLSNYFEYLMQKAPQVLDFLPHTHGGVFSCQIHVTKPDPRIYQHLCKTYALRPEECLFIDDSPANVA